MSKIKKLPVNKLRAKWIAALRSGKYKQGVNRLRTQDNCFCCLGVAADILGPGNWEQKDFEWLYRVNALTRPREVDLSISMLQRFGLDKSDQEKLVSMNDDGKSFSEIANYIETSEDA
jgi:hypothetical protein